MYSEAVMSQVLTGVWMKIQVFFWWCAVVASNYRHFIVLMYTIKCWYNTPLQVLTAAPALHSLIVFKREDVSDILEFLNHIHGNLSNLILKYCCLRKGSTGLLAKIVDLYPDLQGLSLLGCTSLPSADYHLIPCLKKLSELNLSYCKVDYLCVINC
jgi:hypothetical protein